MTASEQIQKPKTSISDLPAEVLLHVSSFLPNAQSVANLSRTSRSFNSLITESGWRDFFVAKFPSFDVSGSWKDASHALTTLSRNFDRRAIIGRPVLPPTEVFQAPARDGGRLSRQTVDFRPVIDSYEDWTGSTWNERKEVLAYGAGAKLMVRRKEVVKQSKATQDTSAGKRAGEYGAQMKWLCYEHPDTREGIHDITSLQIFKPRHQDAPGANGERFIIGNEAGDLLALRQAHGNDIMLDSTFQSNGQRIVSTDLSWSSSPLLAAASGLQTVSLYATDQTDTSIEPLSTIEADVSKTRIWTTKFVSQTDLAVGFGAHTEPLSIYRVTPAALEPEPVRRFEITSGKSEIATSVYCIAPLPSVHDVHDGPLFLTGSYDGTVRLHDLRAPEQHVALFPTEDFNPVYSLAPVGRERIVYGLGRHSLLSFRDLRIPGGRQYHYADPARLSCANSTIANASGWNMFLFPTSWSRRRQQDRSARQGWHFNVSDRWARSAVYSLSSPAAHSPTLYAGVAGRVVQLDLAAPLDAHPDPAQVAQMPPALQDETASPQARWSRHWNAEDRPAMQMAYYEVAPGRNWHLREQMGMPTAERAPVDGGTVDERWVPVERNDDELGGRPVVREAPRTGRIGVQRRPRRRS
jgi:WD40 repeat protein